uniref:SUN domain-containing protein n=1 Tax=Sphenodon punctatus TaxID=8508 RepID=A0A8D0H185_SPHPU
MSRRSQRLGTTRYYQGDDDGTSSSSAGSSLQELPRLVSHQQRAALSHTILLPLPAAACASGRLLLGFSKRFCVSWTGEQLSVRRRRGTGGTESSKINGLTESKTYASSSGYSSEDDYAGHSCLDQTGSGFRNVLFRAGSFLWLVLTSPGRLFGLLYWWIGMAWYRLTTTASLLDVFVLTRSVWGGWELRCFLSVMAGAWYFYPFGLHSSMFSWGAVKFSPPVARRGEMHGAAGSAVISEVSSSKRNPPPAPILLLTLLFQVHTWRRHKNTCSIRHMLCFPLMFSSARGILKESSQQEMSRLEAQLASLKNQLVALESDQEAMAKQVELLPGQIKGMRDDVEAQFPSWISQFLSQPREDGAGSLFLQRGELQERLRELERKILAKVYEDQRMSAQEARASIGGARALQQEGVTGVTEKQVHLIVNWALKYFSEDCVGMVDYALESAGASVISTRCSETYETKTALLSLFGIPLWYHSQSPWVILQPDVNPGNCWAFRGSQGFAVIRLSSNIHPTAVTLEHIPRSLSPMGAIPSAPKDFAVYSLAEEGQQEGTLLGQFMYDQDRDPIQTFHFQGENLAASQGVELRILSNWGHPEYTCIYCFRVHGDPVH